MQTHDITTKRGTTWKGMQITISVNASPLNLTGATISMKLKKKGALRTAALDYEWIIGNGITVTNASAGQFAINNTDIDLIATSYNYEIDITLASGIKETYVGGTFLVEDDIG